MSPTPFYDLADQLRGAAVKGTRCHLDVDLARAAAQHPRIMALLAELAAEETTKLCHAEPLPDLALPLFPPAPDLSPMPSGQKPRGATASAPSTSIGAETGSDMPLPGMTPQLVQDAASSQALVQARALIHQSKHNKRSRRTSPPMPAPKPPRARPKLASLQS